MVCFCIRQTNSSTVFHFSPISIYKHFVKRCNENNIQPNDGAIICLRMELLALDNKLIKEPLVVFKNSKWIWMIDDIFSLNISFTEFSLQYSGEGCWQERVVIYSELNTSIGRYCGRRYMWVCFCIRQTNSSTVFHFSPIKIHI